MWRKCSPSPDLLRTLASVPLRVYWVFPEGCLDCLLRGPPCSIHSGPAPGSRGPEKPSGAWGHCCQWPPGVARCTPQAQAEHAGVWMLGWSLKQGCLVWQQRMRGTPSGGILRAHSGVVRVPPNPRFLHPETQAGLPHPHTTRIPVIGQQIKGCTCKRENDAGFCIEGEKLSGTVMGTSLPGDPAWRARVLSFPGCCLDGLEGEHVGLMVCVPRSPPHGAP